MPNLALTRIATRVGKLSINLMFWLNSSIPPRLSYFLEKYVPFEMKHWP